MTKADKKIQSVNGAKQIMHDTDDDVIFNKFSRECKREKSAKTWCLPPTASRLIYTGLSPAAASTNLLITTSQPTATLQCDLWNIFEKSYEKGKNI